MFDLTSRDSFLKVEQQIANFQAHCPAESQNNVVLVGNKCDLAEKRKLKIAEQRQVEKEEGELLAEKLNCMAYYETSAKTGTQIDEVFYSMALACLNMPEEEGVMERRSTLQQKREQEDSSFRRERTQSNADLDRQELWVDEPKQKKDKCC